MTARVQIGIITVSDRVARGEAEDASGPAVLRILRGALTGDWEALPRVVPDEGEALRRELVEPSPTEPAAAWS
ncbi:MAG: hypothetical protein R2991_03600 [Thermoanaerobaculia bacterium]